MAASRPDRQPIEERRGAVPQVAPEAYLELDRDGVVIEWSAQAEATFGWARDEVVGRRLAEVILPTGSREMALAAFVDTAEGPAGARRVQLSALHRDGHAFLAALVLWTGTEGSVHAFVHEHIDRRERPQGALAQAREAEAYSRRLLADAAHKLRTPIAGLRACAEALPRAASPDERERLLADLVRESERATRHVGSLLTLARLDQGRALAPTACDLLALCGEEAERARVLSPHLEITVRAVGDPGQHPRLDREAVGEILAALLDNARRHARRQIEVRVRSDEDSVELRILDDGPGLADDMVERAFERFASLDRKGGTGLGLPIARGLARAHGGDLTYEEGAFVVCLRSPGLAPAAISDQGDGRRPP